MHSLLCQMNVCITMQAHLGGIGCVRSSYHPSDVSLHFLLAVQLMHGMLSPVHAQHLGHSAS